MKDYQILIENALKKSLLGMGPNSLIRQACEYALLNGGKLIRPCLSLMIADALQNGADVMQASLTVEYFHTASLIADDLPSMDDDDLRREKPSLHKVHNEAIALLATYALIAEGYRCLWINAESIAKAHLFFSHQSDTICKLALENATYNTGLQGATGGQFLDIKPPDLSLETIKTIIHRKTTALFETSFVIGWLYGGGSIQQLELVKNAAKHFGLAFQIADDIGDREQDAQNQRLVNVANLFGLSFAENLLEQETNLYLKTLCDLNIATDNLKEISHFFSSIEAPIS